MNILLFKTYLFIARGKILENTIKKNKLKTTASLCNDEFELPGGLYSASEIPGYIKYIIKNRETLTTILPIHVYINSINNRLVFKIKDEYKLELQMKQ